MARFDEGNPTVSAEFTMAYPRYGQGQAPVIEQTGEAVVNAISGFELARLEGTGNISGTSLNKDDLINETLNLTQIATARQQGLITADEAKARVNVALKESVNRLPGLESELRRRATSFFGGGTGRGGALSETAAEKFSRERKERDIIARDDLAREVEFSATKAALADEQSIIKSIGSTLKVHMTTDQWRRLAPETKQEYQKKLNERGQMALRTEMAAEKLSLLTSQKGIRDLNKADALDTFDVVYFGGATVPSADGKGQTQVGIVPRLDLLKQKIDSLPTNRGLSFGEASKELSPTRRKALLEQDNNLVDTMTNEYKAEIAQVKATAIAEYMASAQAAGISLTFSDAQSRVGNLLRTLDSMEKYLEGKATASKVSDVDNLVSNLELLSRPDKINRTLEYLKVMENSPLMAKAKTHITTGAGAPPTGTETLITALDTVAKWSGDRVEQHIGTVEANPQILENNLQSITPETRAAAIATWQLQGERAKGVLQNYREIGPDASVQLEGALSSVFSPANITGVVKGENMLRGMKTYGVDELDKVITIAKAGPASAQKNILSMVARYNENMLGGLEQGAQDELRNNPGFALEFDNTNFSVKLVDRREGRQRGTPTIMNRLGGGIRPDLLAEHYYARWTIAKERGEDVGSFPAYIAGRLSEINPVEEQVEEPTTPTERTQGTGGRSGRG